MKLIWIKLVILTLAITGCTVSAQAPTKYSYQIVRVIDGDTVVVSVPFLPPELGNTLSLRVLGVDTPEKAPRARCTEEARKSVQAKQFTEQQIKSARPESITVVFKKWDKYGGRVLGDVYIGDVALSKLLIDNQHAVAYDGGTKVSWCKRGSNENQG